MQDILYSRRTTTDIQKIEFTMKIPRKYGGGSQNFWMFDVGGQKGARKKWIQVRLRLNYSRELSQNAQSTSILLK